jgi:hypothetical protein
LWSDGQWYFNPQYRKDDARAVAGWLEQNQERVSSWLVLPEYMNTSLEWYLRPYPEVLARRIAPGDNGATTFPTVPDVLILSRRHHLLQPDRMIASYAAAVQGVQTNRSFAGFELYVGAKRAGAGK